MLVGLDICSTERMARLIRNSPFVVSEVFSESEIAYCSSRKRTELHFAARWSAKEALLKALGIGVLRYDLSKIEIAHGEAGKPYINITSTAIELEMQRIVGIVDYV